LNLVKKSIDIVIYLGLRLDNKSAINPNRREEMTSEWIDVDAELVKQTEKAVLLDFGADRGCHHQAWVPKSHYREIERKAFKVQQITKQWVSRESLWRWI